MGIVLDPGTITSVVHYILRGEVKNREEGEIAKKNREEGEISAKKIGRREKF